PTPVQRPRVPIWVGGGWPGKPSMRRAARWDGETLGFIHGLRAEAGIDDQPFDLVLGGTTKPGAAAVDRVGPLAAAGAPGWTERIPYPPGLVDADATRRRIEAGPPHVT